MKQTSKYQLNLIENSDRFLAEPINENMQTIEDALLSHNVDSSAHSALQTATANHIADKNNPHGVTAAQVGAAASTHNHSASNITSGTLSTARGGTGNTSVDTTPTNGSTKMVTSGGIYTALAGKSDTSHTHSTYAASSHNHAAGNITSGTLPVARGGTGNTSVDTTPTSGSTKMVTSGGVYTALANHKTLIDGHTTALAKKYGTDNLPWVTGTYTGTGVVGTAQEISVGFQPSLVFVISGTLWGMMIRHGNSTSSLSTRIGAGTNYGHAHSANLISATSSGFTVIKDQSYNLCTLNESDTTYLYIAFK